MINYQEACEIAKTELKEQLECFDKITVTEIDEGWVFSFGKTDKELSGSSSRMITKENGSVKPFSIPPIKNIEKLKTGKKIEYKK